MSIFKVFLVIVALYAERPCALSDPDLVAFILTATETAQQLKRSAGVPFHAKGRGLLRKMDTTSKAPVLSGGGAAVAARREGLP